MASLRKNTASQKVTFCLVNATTGAALATATFTSLAWVTVDGSQAGFAGTFTTLGNGQYQYAPTQAETNGVDIGILVTVANAVPVNLDFHTDDPTIAETGVNVVNWNGTVVATPATAGIPDVNAKNINNVATTSVTTINANQGTTQPVNFTGTAGSALVKGDAIDINSVAASSVTTINANIGTTQPINFTGTAGSALVKGDAIDINSVAASSVTTINANIGTTQPINFTGTAGSALVKSDAVDIAGSAVSTSSAQLGVNVVNIAGQAAALDTNNLLKVDVEDIGGSATGGTNLSHTTGNIGRGTCTSGGSTTSIPTSAFTPGGGSIVSNQFVGRTMIFDGNTATGALQGQASNITSNTSGATPTFVVSTLTTAPSSGDTFTIV